MSIYTLPIATLVDKLVELVEKYETASKSHALDKANFENLKNQEDSYLSVLKLRCVAGILVPLLAKLSG